MALSVVQANAVSTNVYEKDFKENVYDSHPFTMELQQRHKITVKGGNQITFPVRYKRLGTAKAVGWTDQETFQSIDTFTQGVLDWAPYRASTMITWEQRDKNQAGPQQIVDLLKSKAEELKEDVLYILATDLFATSSVSGHVIPLSTIVDSADSYAGIDPSDASVWAGIEDSSSTQLTRSLLYGKIASSSFGERQPSAHFTTRTLQAKYNLLLSGDERYMNTKTANAMFTTITLSGKPVYSDSYVASTYWFGLDIGAFELTMMTNNDMNIGKWMETDIIGYPRSLVKVCTFVANLVCKVRRSSFKLSALTGT